MKKLFKRIISVGLCAAMLASASTVAAFAQTEESASDNYYKGTFYYRPGLGEIAPLTDSVDYYAYSDDYFKADSRVYNDHLSTMSMCIGEASVSSTREPFTLEGYKNKNRDIRALLEDLGFSDIKINDAYTVKPTKDSIGVSCSHKKIVDGDKEYTLLTIVPRSAGYEAEWGNNFVLGESGDAKGFDGCSETCLAFARDYIEETGITGDIKVWTVGYSRGAAISNLIARKLIDAPQDYLGEAVNVTPDNLYAYTFGTPSAADLGSNPRAEKYAGIFNSYANTEISSSMAPIDMGFGRYGTDNMFLNDENKAQMEQNLAICNPGIYEMYLQGLGSTGFSPKKLGFVDGSIGMVNDENSYIPANAAEYLRGLGAYLNQVSGGRENFSKVYEQPFSDFLAYYESLTGDNSTAFTSTLTGHSDTLSMVVAVYAYFMKYKLKNNVNATPEEAEAITKELAAVSAPDGETTGIGAADIAKAAAKLIIYLTMSPERLKPIAANYLGNVLGEAMANSGATKQQINAICNQDSLEALVHLISHLLLGNIWQSGKIRPLNIDNEQIKNAATLIGNFTNIMADHANEVIISWLRTSDSYFDDYAALTEEQILGYRRVYITADNALNGEIINNNGQTVAKLENGALTDVTDKWIGFTSTDEGGFFRLPMDDTYIFMLSDVKGAVNVKVGEYDCYTAETTMVFEKAAYAESETTAVLTLTKPETAQAVPTDAEYSFAFNNEEKEILMGDLNGDGYISVLDVTMLQRAIANVITLNAEQKFAADVNCDGAVSVLDATVIQTYLAEFDNVEGYAGKTVLYHA